MRKEARRKEYGAHAITICLFVTFPIWVLPWSLYELYVITQQSAWEWLNRREMKRKRSSSRDHMGIEQ